MHVLRSKSTMVESQVYSRLLLHYHSRTNDVLLTSIIPINTSKYDIISFLGGLKEMIISSLQIIIESYNTNLQTMPMYQSLY